jgi:hypothetical protein
MMIKIGTLHIYMSGIYFTLLIWIGLALLTQGAVEAKANKHNYMDDKYKISGSILIALGFLTSLIDFYNSWCWCSCFFDAFHFVALFLFILGVVLLIQGSVEANTLDNDNVIIKKEYEISGSIFLVLAFLIFLLFVFGFCNFSCIG